MQFHLGAVQLFFIIFRDGGRDHTAEGEGHHRQHTRQHNAEEEACYQDLDKGQGPSWLD